MADEPDSLVLQRLRQIRADMATKAELNELRSEFTHLKGEVNSLRADAASDLAIMQGKTDAEFKQVASRSWARGEL